MPGKKVVWIVSMYDMAPNEGWRPARPELLTRRLLPRGFEVVHWAATYSHHKKEFRAKDWDEVSPEPGATVRFVPSTAYAKNVSFDRIKSEKVFSENFAKRAIETPPPSCIVVREPPSAGGLTAISVGKQLKAPVISDVYDLWPELFHRVLPKPIRGLGKVLFAPNYAKRRQVWSNVQGFCALSEVYLDFGMEQVPSLRSKPHAFAYNSVDVDLVQSMLKARSELVEKKVGHKGENDIWIGYAGSLSHGYDVPTVLKAAKQLRRTAPNVKFVVSGVGQMLPDVEAASKEPGSNILCVGKMFPSDLYPMLGKCDLGLCCYAADTTVAMPDKFYDYAAAGLPMVTSIKGESWRLTQKHDMGVQYQSENPDDLASKVEAIAKDRDGIKRMSSNAVEAARSWDARKEFDKFADLVERTIEIGV